MALTRKSPDGTYLTYFPFELLTEASQIQPKLEPQPNLLSEWCRCGADTKKPDGTYFHVFPIWAFD